MGFGAAAVAVVVGGSFVAPDDLAVAVVAECSEKKLPHSEIETLEAEFAAAEHLEGVQLGAGVAVSDRGIGFPDSAVEPNAEVVVAGNVAACVGAGVGAGVGELPNSGPAAVGPLVVSDSAAADGAVIKLVADDEMDSSFVVVDLAVVWVVD